MRRAAHVDGNQAAIVSALRAAGASVQSLAAVGGGCPDLLVGHRGRNYLLEVKNPAQRPSERRLRRTQVCWHGVWTGQVVVVHTPEEALEAIGLRGAA